MAQATPTPAVPQNLSSTAGLQPFAGTGGVLRTAIVNATGSSFSISPTTMSASGMTGLYAFGGASVCTTPTWITGATLATSNGDTTIGASAGPWVITLSDTRPADIALWTVSRT